MSSIYKETSKGGLAVNISRMLIFLKLFYLITSMIRLTMLNFQYIG